MQTLLIDNYDSFTFNLFQLLAEANGVEPVVVRNDEASWDELARLRFDNVVISPGPGRPDVEGDFGVCAEAIRRCEKPLLGVCLGHQGIGWVEGGEVAAAPEPMHGRVVEIEHDGSPLLAGIPSPFRATRYHSLALTRPLPRSLREIASCEGVPMALEHRDRPRWGVQFHPESIATEHGRRLLENFRDLTPRRHLGPRGEFANHELTKSPSRGEMAISARMLDALPDPEAAFVSLYGESENAFWLDSSRPGERGRFSFIGDASGPLAEVVAYDVERGELTLRRPAREQGSVGGRPAMRVSRESIFDYLDRRTAELRPAEPPDLPFEFDCGFVGYLGYELKAECGHGSQHSSEHPDAAFILADRVIAFDHEAGRTYLLALHRASEERGNQDSSDDWLKTTATHLASLAGAPNGGWGESRRTLPAVVRRGSPDPPPDASDRTPGEGPSLDSASEREPGEGPRTLPAVVRGPSPGSPPNPPSLSRPEERYIEDVETCLDHLRAGDSYELCLTNQLSVETDADPLGLYLSLRRANPAPFAAYLRFGGLAVLSSSPERFLRVGRDGEAEARPIKGTSRRGADPAEDAALAAALAASEKNRAENLMIVDLLRNDLGRVCEVGSVAVPQMIEVETYETVHQLVSAVSGRLRAGASAADSVRACFPPGSMTGAPKLRATRILDDLEGAARGVYSGAIGWFGLGAAADLAVAIRTIVLADGRAAIGAGGAVVLASEPEREYEEMLLKAAAPLRAIDPGADPASISLALQGAAAATPP